MTNTENQNTKTRTQNYQNLDKIFLGSGVSAAIFGLASLVVGSMIGTAIAESLGNILMISFASLSGVSLVAGGASYVAKNFVTKYEKDENAQQAGKQVDDDSGKSEGIPQRDSVKTSGGPIEVSSSPSPATAVSDPSTSSEVLSPAKRTGLGNSMH